MYESQNITIIKAFVNSPKTKSMFNFISLEEKKRFVQFTIISLEKFIISEIDDNLDFENESDVLM